MHTNHTEKYINCKHTSMYASRHKTANHVYTYIQALSGILFTGCWGQVDIIVILGLLSEDWRHLSTSCRLPTSSSRNWNSPTPFHCVEELVQRWQNDISNFTVKGLEDYITLQLPISRTLSSFLKRKNDYRRLGSLTVYQRKNTKAKLHAARTNSKWKNANHNTK